MTKFTFNGMYIQLKIQRYNTRSTCQQIVKKKNSRMISERYFLEKNVRIGDKNYKYSWKTLIIST